MLGFRRLFGFGRRWGLALGAGGARGLAHLGVLRALAEQGIEVGFIAGASMGAIVGAMFALSPDHEKVSERIIGYLEANRDKLRHFSLFHRLGRRRRGSFGSIRSTLLRFFFCTILARRTYILGGELLEDFICAMLPDADIRETKIPFAAVAYDLSSAEEVVLVEGSIRRAVMASSSIPGVFPPVDWFGRPLVDGGGISPVPVSAVRRLGARRVLAVDVSPLPKRRTPIESGLEIILRAEDGEAEKLKRLELEEADLVVCPPLGSVQWWRFEYYARIIERGYRTARRVLREKL